MFNFRVSAVACAASLALSGALAQPFAQVHAPRHEIVFVESALADYPHLVSGLRPGVEVHVLDRHSDGLAQMARVLAGHRQVDAVHLFSHGAPGRLELGTLTLGLDNLPAQREALAQIGSALKPGGDWLLYGCEVAQGAAGQDFVARLAQLSGADVAASTDLSGATARGGNWVLELAQGPIEAGSALSARGQAEYAGVLKAPVPTATAGAESISVTAAAPNAALKLYKALGGGPSVASGTAASDGSYTFTGLVPVTGAYYVTQDDGSGESDNTPFLNPTLRTPVATSGTESVDVSNVSSLARIKLFRTDGTTTTLVSSSPTDLGGGVFRFSDVVPYRQDFYVMQFSGDTDDFYSANTPFFGIPLRVPAITAGVRQVNVSNVYPGATVTLYKFDGTVVSDTPTILTSTTVRFSNVEPYRDGHYVVQSVNGVVSVGSNVAVVTATAPTFVGGLTNLSVNAAGTEFRDQLAVSDIDVGQALSWTVSVAPSHGTLSGFPASAQTNCENTICGTVGSTDTRPSAPVTYTPGAGYTGSDTFTIEVSDGVATSSRSFTVSVNAASGSSVAAPDSTALAAAIDNPAVSTITLSPGVTYQIAGTEIKRPLTIVGNGAVIEVLRGAGQGVDDQTIYHLGVPDVYGNRRYRGNLFWHVSDGGQLSLSNLTLRNAATTANAQGLTGIWAALYFTGSAQGQIDNVTFQDFWFRDSQYLAQNNLATAQGLYASYSDLSYGVYAAPEFQGTLTVSHSVFDSSNAFREAIHLGNSQSATVSGNTFNGTAHADRLRAADGFEYGLYLSGGQSSITGNTFDGFQAHLNSNYYSAGIGSVGLVAGSSATITGNTIRNSSMDLTLTGGWQLFKPGGEISINGHSLITDPGLAGFSVGNSNTLSAGLNGPRIGIAKDQNDTVSAYSDPLLSYVSRTAGTVTLGLAAGTVPAINSTAFVVQQSTDGQNWSNATVTPARTLTSTDTSFTVSGLDSATRYYFRLNDTDSSSNYVGWSNLIGLPTLSLSATTETTAVLSFAATGSTGVRVERSTDGGSTWTAASLQSPLTGASTSATVTGLSAGTSYLLRLNGSGSSGWGASAPLSVNTAAGATCGTAQGQPTVSVPLSGGLCVIGAASAVSAGSSSWTWSCTSDSVVSQCSAPFASTVTGSGSGHMVLGSSSGPQAWQVRSANFISAASVGTTPPASYNFPHGLLDLTLDTGSAGTGAQVTITYPSPLPPGTVYMKYGKTQANPQPHWYPYSGALIQGNTVTLTLTDGGDGDDDLRANSLIVDPGGPATPPDLSGIPTLSGWGRLGLLALLGLAGALGLRRSSRAGRRA